MEIALLNDFHPEREERDDRRAREWCEKDQPRIE